MKKMASLVTGVVVVLAVCLQCAPASAASAKVYSNCAALNKAYPGGVAFSKSSVNRGGKTKYRPTVNAAVFRANSSKDRDHDGIACER